MIKIIRNVYLDYAATTPLDSEVLEEMLPYLKEKFGNPSSIHKYGQDTRTAVEISRAKVAEFLNAKQSEIIFTSGGTEAINLALIGTARVLKKEYNKTKIITSKAEHHATLETCKFLENEGFEVVYLNPSKDGDIKVYDLLKNIDDRTGLVSLLHVNNETGTITDINTIVEELKNRDIIIHVDAVQSFGKFSIDVTKTKIDLLSASAHKIYGPKGVGILYVRTGTPISPLIFGGAQERNRRGGTENVYGIVGLAKAVEIAQRNMSRDFQHVLSINQYFKDKLLSLDEEVLINSPEKNSSPYILNISLNPEKFSIDENALIINFTINGVAVSSGSACTSGVLETSHVLLSMGIDEKRASMAIRFSFGKSTSFEEIDYAMEVLKKILGRLKIKNGTK